MIVNGNITGSGEEIFYGNLELYDKKSLVFTGKIKDDVKVTYLHEDSEDNKDEDENTKEAAGENGDADKNNNTMTASVISDPSGDRNIESIIVAAVVGVAAGAAGGYLAGSRKNK